MSHSDRLTIYLTAMGLLLLGFGCSALLGPITTLSEAPIPPGHARAVITVQMPAPKVTGFTAQATNDRRNVTLPARMRLSVTGLDVAAPIEPSGDYQNPIPLAASSATVAMIVPLGKNLIMTAVGETLTGDSIASAVVKGYFSATVDQGTVTCRANRLTTPVAETLERILAKQDLGPDEQRRSRNLLLSIDPAPLQQFILTGMLGGTGNQSTDLQKLADGQLLKHPALVNTAAVAKYLWERAAVPPNATFLVDEQGRGPFLTPGKVTGTVTGVRPGIPVTVLVDDPVSQPVMATGGQAFTVNAVVPGAWRVHAVASGYRGQISHFNGAGTVPTYYALGEVPPNGTRPNMDFSFSPAPAGVAGVRPARGPRSPDLSNPTYLSMQGLDFGPTQDGAVVVFRNVASGATLAANLVDRWSDTDVRVAVPAMNAGNYQVRIDKPTANPGEFVTGATVAGYAAGTWGLLYSPAPIAATLGNPLTGSWQTGVAQNNDLQVDSRLYIGWGSVLRAYQPTLINIGSGGTIPAVAINDQNTAIPAGASRAVHPDGRILYLWSDGTQVLARAFGVDGTPLGAAYPLVASSLSNQCACGSDAAAFDSKGGLHVAFKIKQPDTPRPTYQRFAVDGLGVATALTQPLRCDTSTALTTTQGVPRLRVGINGHVGVSWVDSRGGQPDHYFRLVKPDGSFAGGEVIRPAAIVDFAVDSQGGVALSTFQPSEQKLARYNPDGTLAGETTEGQWTSVFNGAYTVETHRGLSRLLFDPDDRLIATGFTTVRIVRSPNEYGRTVFIKGFLAATGAGYLPDSLRSSLNVISYGASPYAPARTGATMALSGTSPLCLGPDGTVSLMCTTFVDFPSPGSVQMRLAQYGWR